MMKDSLYYMGYFSLIAPGGWLFIEGICKIIGATSERRTDFLGCLEVGVGMAMMGIGLRVFGKRIT